uniref:WAP domain-containing protein n=1 Tax=Aquila chrysaetos chrysaetos TaxID=223781 RepID=A0A663ET82_AQUCH
TSKQLRPLAGSASSCPPVHITCAMVNPPNHCYTDRHCPRYKKCCPTFWSCVQLPEPPTVRLVGRLMAKCVGWSYSEHQT